MGPILLVSNSIIFVGILVGIFFLQIFLSTKENKKLGLILPGINFVISILISLIYLLNALTLDVSIFIGMCLMLF